MMPMPRQLQQQGLPPHLLLTILVATVLTALLFLWAPSAGALLV